MLDVDNIHLGWYVSRSSLKEETVLLVQVVVFQDKKKEIVALKGADVMAAALLAIVASTWSNHS